MRDLPLIRSVRSAVVFSLAIVVPLVILATDAVAAIYTAMLAYAILPCVLCITCLYAGVLPMLVGYGGAMLALHIGFGWQGALLGGLYLFIFMAAFVAVMAKGVRFWHAVGVMVGAHVAAQLMVFLVLQSWAGGQLYSEAARIVTEYLRGSEIGDMILVMLHQYGLVQVAQEFVEQPGSAQVVNGVYVLSEALRSDLLLAVELRVEEFVKAFFTGSIVSHSVISGTFSVALPLYFGNVAQQRREYLHPDIAHAALPAVEMPPLEKWFLPRGMGLKVGILFVGQLVAMFTTNDALVTAGLMMYSAFQAIYMIQGMALINFMQKKRDSKPGWRKATLILLYAFLPTALVLLGVFDQIANVRGLRPPRQAPAE